MLDPEVNLRSPVYYREWTQKIIRYWLPVLSAPEALVLLMVFDRTIGWGKEWELITVWQFEYGLEITKPNQKTYRYSGGIPIKRTAIKNALRSLVEKKCLLTSVNNWGKLYAINFEWRPEMLAIPKRNQLQKSTDEGGR